MMVGDGGSATSSSICSQCTARVATGGKRDNETQGHRGTADSAGTETRSVSRRRRFENERGMGESRSRGSKTDRRFRRLEKTVESLSHGLILALTQLKCGDMYADTEPHRWGSGPGPHHRPGHSDVAKDEIESVSGNHSVDDDGRDLSTVFARLGFINSLCGGIGTTAPSLQQPDNKLSSSLEENLLRMLLRLPQTTTIPVTSKAGPGNSFNCIATGNDGTLFTTGKDRSPIPQMLSPILRFITSSGVFQFLKRAEMHAGLLKTQLFDLFWILDNLFNVHGGILIYCLLKSLNTMDGISLSLGLDEWSQDQDFLRKLDDAYRKDLRLHIQTGGSHKASASAAWKSYCFELAQIFSEQFSSRRSVGYFRELSESHTSCFNPVVTPSYIEDLAKQWTAVRHALLEVTRWFEPFIDYGPDCNRSAPFYDATIVLGCRARELLSREGVKEPEVSRRADCLLQRLCELRFDQLMEMQSEMTPFMDNVSRDFNAATGAYDGDGDDNTSSDSGSGSGSGPPSTTAEEAALLERVKRVTGGWPVITTTESLGDQSASDAGCGSSDRLRDALALHEVRVMKSYRPRLLQEGLFAAAIRCEIVHILSDGRNGRGCDITAKDIFWDGIV